MPADTSSCLSFNSFPGILLKVETKKVKSMDRNYVESVVDIPAPPAPSNRFSFLDIR